MDLTIVKVQPLQKGLDCLTDTSMWSGDYVFGINVMSLGLRWAVGSKLLERRKPKKAKVKAVWLIIVLVKRKKNLFDVLFLNCDWFTLEINGLLDISRDSVAVAQHISDLNTMHMETCYYERDLHVIAQELVHLKGAYSRLKLEIYFFFSSDVIKNIDDVREKLNDEYERMATKNTRHPVNKSRSLTKCII